MEFIDPHMHIALATGNNARAYDLTCGMIAEGREADLVVLDAPWVLRPMMGSQPLPEGTFPAYLRSSLTARFEPCKVETHLRLLEWPGFIRRWSGSPKVTRRNESTPFLVHQDERSQVV